MLGCWLSGVDHHQLLWMARALLTSRQRWTILEPKNLVSPRVLLPPKTFYDGKIAMPSICRGAVLQSLAAKGNGY